MITCVLIHFSLFLLPSRFIYIFSLFPPRLSHQHLYYKPFYLLHFPFCSYSSQSPTFKLIALFSSTCSSSNASYSTTTTTTTSFSSPRRRFNSGNPLFSVMQFMRRRWVDIFCPCIPRHSSISFLSFPFPSSLPSHPSFRVPCSCSSCNCSYSWAFSVVKGNVYFPFASRFLWSVRTHPLIHQNSHSSLNLYQSCDFIPYNHYWHLIKRQLGTTRHITSAINSPLFFLLHFFLAANHLISHENHYHLPRFIPRKRWLGCGGVKCV